ncbi:MAG: nucleotidyltransferase domain-containing protein [Motiliproteus sp.]
MAELIAILHCSLPEGVKAYAFGSRATGTARSGSDLDLLLDAEKVIDWTLLATLEEALSESDLPFRVDVLDKALVSNMFLSRIKNALISLPIS